MWQRPQRKKNAAGFTILETIIAVSILGAVLSGFAVLNRTPDVRLYSDDVQAIVQQARLEAVKQNRPVAFLWDAIAGEFSTRYAPSPTASTVAAACASTTTLVRRATDDVSGSQRRHCAPRQRAGVVAKHPTLHMRWRHDRNPDDRH